MGRVSNSKSKPDKRIIEKNRRIEMKDLCFKLASLIPHHHFTVPKEYLSQQDQIGKAAGYIKNLRERVEELKRRKSEMKRKREMPILKIKDFGSDVEVVLISGPRKNFMLHDIVTILEEEGTQVLTISVCTIDHNIFHTLHAKVKVARVGVDISRIVEKIQEMTS